MRYLGIDYGSKRVGVAISDSDTKLAFPYLVVPNDENLIDKICTIIKKENITNVVIGDSKDFSGVDNKIMLDTKKFVEILEEKTKIAVVYEPEFLSSHQAERWQGKNENLDASAAAIILQSFLDRSRS